MDHMCDMRQQRALAAKAAGSMLSCMSGSRGCRLRDIRLHLGNCVHFQTVHQQTRASPETATEMVRRLGQMMHKERLTPAFVQHGERKFSGGGSPKGQVEPGFSVVRGNRQQTPTGTWEIPVR